MVIQSLKSAYKKFPSTFTSLLLGRTPHKQMTDPHVFVQTHRHINCVSIRLLWWCSLQCLKFSTTNHLGKQFAFHGYFSSFILSLHSLTSYIILTLIADMWPLSRKFWYKFSLTSLECDCSVSIHRPPAVVKEISWIFSTQETCCQWLYSLPGNLRSTEILNSENWMQCNGQKTSHRNVRRLNLTHVANPSLSHK